MKLPSRMRDISVALDNETVLDPPFMRPKIDYVTGKQNAGVLTSVFPSLKTEDLPDGEAWAVENVTLATHNGTHMDAPYHFQSKDIHGNRMITIDEVPLDWFFRPGVKLDFRRLPDGHVVSAAEVEAELKRIGHALQPLDIVLVNTRASECIGTDEYLTAGIGMGREATLYLTSRGVRVCGIDAWGWDAPCTPASAGRPLTTPRSSGRATRPAARSPIATWRSCAISSSCRRMDSLSPASRPRSKPPPAAGPGEWRCSIERHDEI
jgi:kynurenine formamidase